MGIIRYLLFNLIITLVLLNCINCATDESAEIDDDHIDNIEDDVKVEVEEDAPIEPIPFETPDPTGDHYFAEGFKDSSALSRRWVKSQAKKQDVDEEIAKYDGVFELSEPEKKVLTNDLGLLLKSKAKHHAISAKLTKPVDFTDAASIIVQYDIKFQNGQECGGAYIKLLENDKALDLKLFNDKTPYSIMFGPDKCGLESKLHFIVRHANPKSGAVEEKHSKQPDKTIEEHITDKKSHLYTLILNEDNSYEIQIDQKKIMKGNLLETLDPPMIPAKEIEDKDDKKPTDWDDREKIPDPEAKKPDDWDETLPEFILDPEDTKPEGWLDDEPEYIPDPTAEKPDDWDVDMDGEWEAPKIENPACKDAPGCGKWQQKKIKNPDYKGIWKAPMIKNPDFKGKWKPRMIPNPHYFEETNLFKTLLPIGAVGLELWSMSDGIIFDNFIITNDKQVAHNYATETWYAKVRAEAAHDSKSSFFGGLIESANKQPWLWVVYILVVLIPIVLITVFCCSGGKSEDDAKKTDAVSPDDELDEDYANEDVDNMGEDNQPLLNDDAGAGHTNEGAEDSASGTGSSKNASQHDSPSKQATSSKADLEGSSEEEEEDADAEETTTRKRAPIKLIQT